MAPLPLLSPQSPSRCSALGTPAFVHFVVIRWRFSLLVFHGEGYQEGYEAGNSLGIIEGRQYGTLHGAKIGSEIGCYQGFAFAWRGLLHSCTTKKDSKKMKALESLIGMIEKFPYDDPTYDKLHEDLDRIRGKFKQLCSLLNVQPDFKISAEGSGLSF
ncbi:hypothetical protein GH733_007727 [Mirounga leonina]|nr:hypothetical protein GH733_007727 [Mirounga leonina]